MGATGSWLDREARIIVAAGIMRGGHATQGLVERSRRKGFGIAEYSRKRVPVNTPGGVAAATSPLSGSSCAPDQGLRTA